MSKIDVARNDAGRYATTNFKSIALVTLQDYGGEGGKRMFRTIVPILVTGFITSFGPEGLAQEEGRNLPTLPGMPRQVTTSPAPGQKSLEEAMDLLRKERQGLIQDHKASSAMMSTLGASAPQDGGEELKLRLRIAELIGRIQAKPRPTQAPPAESEKPDPVAPTPGLPTSPTLPVALLPQDATSVPTQLALAEVQFQAGQFDQALLTLRHVDVGNLPLREQMWAKFLMAGCHRKAGNLAEAAKLYREVAEVKDDPFLKETAEWHLNLLHWRQELQGELATMRGQRQPVKGPQ
jgi:hypothetical protein